MYTLICYNITPTLFDMAILAKGAIYEEMGWVGVIQQNAFVLTSPN
jgi:hypothetical protein